MKKILINENIKLKKTTDLRGNPIAIIDPDLPENNNIFAYKDIIKEFGGEWSKNVKFKNIFPPNIKGFWFWFLGKTKEQWEYVFERRIKPALEKIYEIEKLNDEDKKKKLLDNLDIIIDNIKNAQTYSDNIAGLNNDEKLNISTDDVLNKLKEFKNYIVNIKDDPTFNDIMKKIITIKQSQGHQFSFINSILIYIQRPNATIVKSKSNWLKYNRIIKNNAKPILLWKPSNSALVPYTEEEKNIIINNFLKSINKTSIEELTPFEKERLEPLIAGKFVGKEFDVYPAYDISDTELISGKEDIIKQSMYDTHFNTTKKDDKIVPIFKAILKLANDLNIKVNFVNYEGPKYGVSKGGEISVRKTDENDIEGVITILHEISHELLHNSYLKEKDQELKNFFLGKSDGIEMIEQQAELLAWMVLASFGFDVKDISLPYITLWGGEPEKMPYVFDKVSNVANYLINEIIKRLNTINENMIKIPKNIKKYTPRDVAKILGVEKEYDEIVNKINESNKLKEEYIIKYKKLIK